MSDYDAKTRALFAAIPAGAQGVTLRDEGEVIIVRDTDEGEVLLDWDHEARAWCVVDERPVVPLVHHTSGAHTALALLLS